MISEIFQTFWAEWFFWLSDPKRENHFLQRKTWFLLIWHWLFFKSKRENIFRTQEKLKMVRYSSNWAFGRGRYLIIRKFLKLDVGKDMLGPNKKKYEEKLIWAIRKLAWEKKYYFCKFLTLINPWKNYFENFFFLINSHSNYFF